MALLPTRQRDQILLMVIVLSLGAMGAYFMYMYSDKAQAITTLAAHVESLDSLNARTNRDVRSGAIDKARQEAKRYERDLVLLDRLVPSSNEVPALLDQISTAVRRAGLELQDVAPAGPQPGEEFDTYKYKVGVIGGYHEVAQCLTNIATLDRIVAPMNLSLLVTAAKGEKKARPGESLLDARFEIQTYVAHAGPQLTVTQAGQPATTQGHP